MSPSAPPALVAMVGKVVDNGALQLLNIIGNGGFGTVFSALDVESARSGNAKMYAVKFVADDKSKSVSQRSEPREVRYHRLVSGQQNIVKLHRVFYEQGYCCIVLDMISGGDLFSHVHDKGTYVGDEAKTKKVLLQMVDAVYQVHENGVAHCDIKPENFLCSADGSRVLLSDFGLASRMGEYEPSRVGSKAFRAPEIIDERGRNRLYHTGPADVFALVVSMIAVLTGFLPWKEAKRSDASYDWFYRYGGLALYQSLPLTEAVIVLLVRGLDPRPEWRITLPELYHGLANIDRFWPTKNEVAQAGDGPVEVMRKYIAVRTKWLAKEKCASKAPLLPAPAVLVAPEDAAKLRARPRRITGVGPLKLAVPSKHKTADPYASPVLVELPPHVEGSGSSSANTSQAIISALAKPVDAIPPNAPFPSPPITPTLPLHAFPASQSLFALPHTLPRAPDSAGGLSGPRGPPLLSVDSAPGARSPDYANVYEAPVLIAASAAPKTRRRFFKLFSKPRIG